MPFVRAQDGVELYYEVKGDGFPIVFTHGNMCRGHQWDLQVTVLSRKYKCIIHDLRGCGLSGKPQVEIYDTKIQASGLHCILAELGVKRAVHVGHSFGGPISLQYFFDYPGEVVGLVFLGSFSAGSQLSITEEQVLKWYDTLEERALQFKKYATHKKFAQYNPYADDLLRTLWEEAVKPPIYAAKAMCRGFFRLDFAAKLSQVNVPTLVIGANHDLAAPVETCSKVLSEALPDSRLEVIKDAGHMFFLEKPEIVNELLWNWLEEKIKP